MKKFGKLLWVFLFVSLIGATQASAGYPDLSLVMDSSSGLSAVIVGSYDEGSFTAAEAETGSALVGSLLTAGIGEMLGMPGLDAAHLSPSELAAYGITDSAELADYIFDVYKEVGITAYLYVNIYRTPGVSDFSGNNIRLDLWLGDASYLLGELGITEDYLYLASFEVPEMYLALAGGFGL